ncbi:hypothetical protein DFJ58DRAFT_720881 [Suillus subalutaceus]|uniref:uncharacterized protein n=1 Tax=Suillus subalutaceus TaxID=48586 RepID=UPI001B864019|nr:uncharacterized protein DFJ58DRAFT_720881 [Suillus subalutaceus]KAG1876410.1 hypothetical protein DFJ58DRAFT_720881 [Suillus subalutaceus]
MTTRAVPRHAFLTSDPWITESKPLRKTRISCTKLIERQVVRAWKRVTGVTRKNQRASFLPKDFILVTSRRRSVMLA